MNERDAWTSERIRTLRGNDSRAAFASRLGVSALTVYRWELPDGAPEARRPRGAILERLQAFAAGAPLPTAPQAAPRPERAAEPLPPPPIAAALPAAAPADGDELAALAPLLDALMDGAFRRAEEGVMGLLTSGALRTPPARALATQALARIQLWERADARGAFTTLFPQIAEADAGGLPANVAREVYVTAALVFGALDGRVFDAGKVSAYVARAERLLEPGGDARARLLLWFAQLSAAYTLNDRALVELHVARGGDLTHDLTSPLLACYAEEIRAAWGFMLSQPARAARHFAEAVRLAREHGFHLLHGRAIAQAARQRVDDGEPPRALLDTVAQIEATFRAARVGPGWHSMFLAYTAGEAHLRLGQLAEAEAAYIEGLRVAEELRWPPAIFPILAARLWLLAGRKGALRPLVDRLRSQRPTVYEDLYAALVEALAALADGVEGKDPEGAVDRFGAAVRRLEAAGGWTYLRRHMALAWATFALLGGSAAQAAPALRHAEQTLDAVPAVWGSAAMDALRGLHAFQEGRPHDARPALERALATFVRADDRLHAALTHLVLAATLADLGAPEAEAVRAEGVHALGGMGLAIPAIARRRAPAPVVAPAVTPAAGAAPVIEAALRLAVRGMSPGQVHRELLDALARSFPNSAVRLDALDGEGRATTLGAVGTFGAEVTWHELGDGTGRRLRVGVGARLGAGEVAALAAIASVAGLALEVASLRGLVDRASSATLDVDTPDVPGFVSSSPSMRRIKADLGRLSRSRATIIVTGESGVGKEVVARAIHDLSARKGRAYVTFNCAAVPRELFEGQLFGYKKGAFTGAAADHPGVIRAADGGTLFLDEVGELPLDVQPKLLRFLENREILPLGERSPITVDVRVIAATLRDLEKLVREGRFREDLFYRLQVVPLHVPPLRDRPEDVLALARHFLRRFTPEGQAPPTLGPDAVVALTSHDWPGNARELRNVIERALAFDPLPPALSAEHLRLD